ncbi:hypothetical protein CDD83_1505 [Cordyceps sp. RAO-2017]|nr:hypothetical protein CDD83_1505 [Cordyceps sp. RAO-2017]
MARKATVVEEVQVLGEKNGLRDSARSSEEVIVERTEPDPETKAIAEQYGVSEKDIVEAREFAASLSLEDVVVILKRVLATHDEDPNFPYENLRRIKEFLATPDALEAPEKHERLIGDMSLLAALVTNNSPYSEVRAVVDNHDDPSTPVSTLRAWTIGIFFSVLLAFVNQLFSIRQPAIPFPSHVAQLLAFPIGKSWERWMPDAALRLPFTRRVVRLNPGRFSKKEHMLITIMATTSSSLPVSNGIIWMQVLPDYLNQQYAKSFGYIFLNSFATSFVGYGLAGIVRRFLVYPASCVWPASLATIALNSALQNEENQPVGGPLRRVWTISRYRFFMLFFAAMFLYFWFPNFLFQALSPS